ncbi:hypothetical protein Asi02nite_22840 [Asanoa siamensis]|uniref:Histidine kinase/HSP90-like ATPase domain-containing protein n=1 Tax=Asanoa siamensis TaxID=926357 RepID=A0ABQ4CN94_9ACTN|nr:hypothetical protein Asi02nite_22840 [Asanoa siamensis]
MTDDGHHRPEAVAPATGSLLLAETFSRGQVTDLRHSFAGCAEAAGLRDQRLDDFVLAVNELITNAVRHGGGAGQLRLWRAGATLVCEVSDGGAGIGAERLANHERPAPDTAGGWGLWLADQLSDSMAVATGPAGTTVRITTSLDEADGRVGTLAAVASRDDTTAGLAGGAGGLGAASSGLGGRGGVTGASGGDGGAASGLGAGDEGLAGAAGGLGGAGDGLGGRVADPAGARERLE